MLKKLLSGHPAEPAEPNLDERSAIAAARAESAKSVFKTTIDELEAAAREQELVAQLAQEEIEELAGTASSAAFQAADNRAAADKLRQLIA
ncbi:hypothetical protein ALI22I_34035 [Saccharothrix sp. ALI-22-I]|uniref:hypothetical protein n=1 Tax=Saccharothrix sp. ALI-22-I TaxID=1933778 RepID=UPI00097CBCA3|nr:hypothetical protein [Saccharothrix sp. ALI-22-I]ONI83515.1 hypothetical protein ALI22I_34035 [Saccharothrix sp. ALI-22-I]